MQLINTRPENRAGSLTSYLMSKGIGVIDLPLLQLEVLALDNILTEQFRDFKQADYVVVVSPTAAEIGLKYYSELGYKIEELHHKIWIAVGKGTQRYLKQHGIESLVPEVETSEGMLTLPVFQDISFQSAKNSQPETFLSLSPKTIAFWRGIGGRTFMMEQLKNQQHKIINMLLYRRILPVHEENLYQQVPEAKWVLMTSEESWRNWCRLADKYHWNLAQYHYIVLGDRVTRVIEDYFSYKNQKGYMDTVYDLHPNTILLQMINSDLSLSYLQSFKP